MIIYTNQRKLINLNDDIKNLLEYVANPAVTPTSCSLFKESVDDGYGHVESLLKKLELKIHPAVDRTT